MTTRFFGKNGKQETTTNSAEAATSLLAQGFEEYPTAQPSPVHRFIDGAWRDGSVARYFGTNRTLANGTVVGQFEATFNMPRDESDKLLAKGFAEFPNAPPSAEHVFDYAAGTWVHDTDPATVNKAKASAKARIDSKAEQVRAKYLTAAPLQSATYAEKAREAREFKAAGYPSAPFVPATWPYVDAEMRAASDATPQAACDRILAEAAQYAQVKGAAIEYERRHGKITVDAAGTASAIATAEAAAHAALDVL